jgi:hypothetical protein
MLATVEAWQDIQQVVFEGNTQAATRFDDRDDRRTLGPALVLPTWSQFLRPSATGGIEFSARLLDNSTSAWSKQRRSFGHILSV